MNSQELKDKLLKLFDDENLTIKEIRQRFYDACKIKKNNQWQKIKSEKKHLLYKNLKNESFRFVHSVNNRRKYRYCVSNYGRVIVVVMDDNLWNIKEQNKEISFDTVLNESNCKLIQSNNGKLAEKIICINNEQIDIASETDIYKLMEEAGWIEKNLIPHHINNDPDDNRVSNLMYLQAGIHSHVHPKK